MALQTVYAARVQVVAGAAPVKLIAASTAREWTEIELVTGGPVFIGPMDNLDETTGFRLTARDPRPFPTGLGFWALVRALDTDAVVQVLGG